jgi:hypothetical protein
VTMQQMREHQPGRTGSYNPNLCSYFHQVMGSGSRSAFLNGTCQSVTRPPGLRS